MINVPRTKASWCNAKYLTLLFVGTGVIWHFHMRVDHLHDWLDVCISFFLILFSALSALLAFAGWLLRPENSLMSFVFELERLIKHFDRQ